MSLLQQPKPRRRIVFMLTPLVDVMFLLLIFFMLSSQTAPYSLLEIMAAGPPGTTQPPPQTTGPAVPSRQMMVSIERGYARVNGERVEMQNLTAAVETLKQAGFTGAMVLTSDAAIVQDVVTVLEVLDGAALAEMQLVTQVTAGS